MVAHGAASIISLGTGERAFRGTVMRQWFRNVIVAIKTVGQGMWVTLWYFLQTYKRKVFTQHFEYPELPVPVKPRYRGFHRFDLTTCIGCDKCARACPVDCIYIEKTKNPVGKGFRVNGFKIDYTKCMFCACASIRARSIASSWARRTIRAATVATAASSISPSCRGNSLGPGVAQSHGGGGVEAMTAPVWTKPADPPPPPKAAPAAAKVRMPACGFTLTCTGKLSRMRPM